MSKKTADLICRGLLMIVAAIREEYGLPVYNNITVKVDVLTINPAEFYKTETLTNSPSPPLQTE